jgi:hypothetical protein
MLSKTSQTQTNIACFLPCRKSRPKNKIGVYNVFCGKRNVKGGKWSRVGICSENIICMYENITNNWGS